MKREIFVFGSNLAGIHFAGSAWAAHNDYGAIYGVGVGLQGNSYAIPTKGADTLLDNPLDGETLTIGSPLKLNEIKLYVDQFIEFAELLPDWTFNVVAIGCGIVGYKPSEIAPMFAGAPENVKLPKEFLDFYLEAAKGQS